MNNPDTTVGLCPVPWCSKEDRPHTYQDCTDQWTVICPSCGVNGPSKPTEEDAKDAWHYLPRPLEATGISSLQKEIDTWREAAREFRLGEPTARQQLLDALAKAEGAA